MAEFINEISKTFDEFILLPNLTEEHHTVDRVSLVTPVAKYGSQLGFGSAHGNEWLIKEGKNLKIPLVTAAMQSVSGVETSVALAKEGGMAFIYCSQSPESQARMVHEVKEHQTKEQHLMVGAAVNTRDYEDRIPKLVAAGVDVLCMDSSDGYSVYQKKVLDYVRKNFGKTVKIGAGNVVSADAFDYLVKNGADFIKVGIGGGSICITRKEKAIGCGQATAVRDVVNARDKHFEETGVYIPVCSDGGVSHDNQIIMAMAFGADFVMMGKYFARFKEAPGELVDKNGQKFKEYWGEGSNRAKNWQRYESDGKQVFEEGVNGLVPFVGNLADTVQQTTLKLKSTMCNLGALNLREFTKKARIMPLSGMGVLEGSASVMINQ